MDDLDALMDPALTLPIRGVEYRVHCSAHQGLRVARLVAEGTSLSHDEERAEIIHILGDTYTHMVEDGVPWAKIAHAGRTALFHFGHSAAAGEKYWESVDVPGNPVPPSPNQKAMGERIRNLFRRSAPARGSAAGN
jgi:hypothetical protein